MFFKRPKSPPPTPAQTWVLGAITPMLEVADFAAAQLLEPPRRPDQLEFIKILGWEDVQEVLEGMVLSLYKGERVQIARLQHQHPQLPRVDGVVYDFVFTLVALRASINAELIDPEDGEGLLYAVARRLQMQFTGWAEFGNAFVQAYALQRQLTDQSAEETRADLDKLAQSMARLQIGLWQAVPWSLELPTTGERHFERATRSFLTDALFYRDRAAFRPSSPNWSLAVAAVYRAWWGEPVDSLEAAEMVTTILARDWGVESRQDLFGAMRGMILEGHRPELTEMQRQEPNGSQVNVLAWDLVRYMQLATSGVCAGFITRDEADALMLHAAHPLQAAYGSWAEMLDAFVVGRTLWQRLKGIDPEEAAQGNAELDDMLETLKIDPYSPCVIVPWNQPLEPIDGAGLFAGFSRITPRAGQGNPHKHEENPYKK
jgi:hypothetical protein